MITNEFIGGFSFRSDVIGKPSKDKLQGLMLGGDWKWADGAQPEHLARCLTEHGYAVTPGRWKGGHKSKKHSQLLECWYLLLDYDAGLSWKEAKEVELFKQYAAFAYTSPSHQTAGKGDRFRIVFALDRVITESEVLDMMIQGLRTLLPVPDDVAINSASLLFGNPNAELYVYNYNNRLDAEMAYIPAAKAKAQQKIARQRRTDFQECMKYTTDNSANRVQRWLSAIPNSARSTWVRVAACLRCIEAQDHEWAFALFEEWSANGYNDFDPDECEKLWDSLDSEAGGFNRLKYLSKYFESNPFEDEVDTRTLNEFINNDQF